MAVRRVATKVEVPIPPAKPSSPMLDQPSTSTRPPTTSPFLPTLLESLLLSIYPATLLLGSLFSSLHSSTRNSTYIPATQSYDPQNAPSYFAKKSNIFNVYFVKIGWLWATAAFFLLITSHASHGPPLSLRLTKRRVQAIARYAAVTTVWAFVTQWFFGPAIIDRSFRWTGGKCAEFLAEGDNIERSLKAGVRGEFDQAFSHAACKAIGGTWTGGHDISGHVFLLILSSAMLWLEILPAVIRSKGLREARRIRTDGGLIRSAAVEVQDRSLDSSPGAKHLGYGVQVALGVAGLSWWMLFMTAAYFHTWFEKVTGLLVAFMALYVIYFLPRGLPTLRKVFGMPGV